MRCRECYFWKKHSDFIFTQSRKGHAKSVKAVPWLSLGMMSGNEVYPRCALNEDKQSMNLNSILCALCDFLRLCVKFLNARCG